MKMAGVLQRRIWKPFSWPLVMIMCFGLQVLPWGDGQMSWVSESLAAANPGQGADGGDEDSAGGDPEPGGEGDHAGDEADSGDTDSEEEAEDGAEAEEADDSDDSGGNDDDGQGGGGEDALDNLSDDGDSDDDSEPDIVLSVCSEEMSMQKKMSVDGLCSTSVGAIIRNRLGFIDGLTPLVAETSAGTIGEGPAIPDALDRQNNQAAIAAEEEQYVPLPEYEEGDIYVYSDGSWEQVVAANHERVEWQNHYGNRSVGAPDFTYKRSEWQTSSRAGVRRFTQTSYLFDKPTTTLWPLTLGSKTRYDEKGKWIGRDGIERVYDSFWRCDVEGRERVQVAAGEFDTWRICCSRYRDSYSFPKSRAREYKTWYYAPSVEHWVLLTRDNRGLKPDFRKELVAVIPDLERITASPQALVQVQQQFQEVLEGTAEHQQDLWIAASGETVVAMTPGPVFASDNGLLCRQYVQEVQTADLTRRYPGIGCRTPDGTWYIPRR